MKLDFKFVSQDAKDAKGMNIRNTAIFHYFNPNGLYQKKIVMDEKISDAVDGGVMKSGAILVHGSFNDVHIKALSKIAEGKNSKRWEVDYTVRKLEEDLEKALLYLCKRKSEKEMSYAG